MHVIPGLAALDIAGLTFKGYGFPGRSCVLEGLVAEEIARVDVSISTFFGVQSGLAMGSMYLCGSEERKRTYLPKMRSFELLGAFGLYRARRRVGRCRRPHDDVPSRRRQLGAQRRKKVDRQRHLLGLHDHLGARRGR